MNIKSIGLALALACFCWSSANAVVVTPQVVSPTQFSFTESPSGQYTVTNNSSSWYIYGFMNLEVLPALRRAHPPIHGSQALDLLISVTA
jgi:hypothetical protein